MKIDQFVYKYIQITTFTKSKQMSQLLWLFTNLSFCGVSTKMRSDSDIFMINQLAILWWRFYSEYI
ncbi:hypothetical protein HanHA300_Chr03g0080541 [Helianthus annuus]|nr:hypothetical protein HanHA300_Chr03g0080541 [Helianthus annuus]KAJ0599472.1 hypothetical protein HanIR_Chr03g0105251 [Helianthus annuus]KAJ0607040.1 hypothetical protein HanHA89_Chr03g0091921 [Helianthus annuus]KAJ0767097.1 hypothetical protein HanLR1_Chr03g0085191 [Helianthus annuus]